MLQGQRAFLMPQSHPSEQNNVIIKVGLLAALHTSGVFVDRRAVLT